MVVECQPCETIAHVFYTSPVAVDSLGVPVVVTPQENFPVLLPVGNHRRSFVATSKGGQVALCSFSVSVTAVICPEPAVPENGILMSKSCGVFHGSIATYACDYPYILRGNQTVRCDEHGNWEGDLPTCVVPVCEGLAGQVDHGHVHPDICNDASVPVGTTCTLTCENGFKLSGANAFTCKSDGSWSGHLVKSACTGMLKFL